jgi:hypothetical protein
MEDTLVLRKRVKKLIDKTSKEEIEIIYKILEYKDDQKDWNDYMERDERIAFDKAMKEALLQVKKGQVLSHEEVMKMSKKWLKK